MINLSPRLALIAAVLFIASALPVWFHVAKTPTSDECRDPEAFFLASTRWRTSSPAKSDRSR